MSGGREDKALTALIEAAKQREQNRVPPRPDLFLGGIYARCPRCGAPHRAPHIVAYHVAHHQGDEQMEPE